jgi:hypothetical protein
MSFGEVTLCIFGLLLLISLFGRLEHLIFETLESVVVSNLVLSLWVDSADPIQEAFKFTRPRPILLVTTWPLHVVHGTIRFSLLVVALGRAWPIRVARLLLLSGVEGRLLGQDVSVGDRQHLFRRPGILHGVLADKG